MKKLLALLTAPLTMTACIDLSNVENANVGTDGEVNNPGETTTGFAALKTQYDNTDIVLPLNTSTDSLASVAVNSGVCSYMETLRGNFDSTAVYSQSAAAIMADHDGNINEGDLTARYEEGTSFFSGDAKFGANTSSTNGYIEFNDAEYDASKIDLMTKEYITDSRGTNEFVVRITDNLTQIHGYSRVEDVIKFTDSWFAHRIVSDGGSNRVNTELSVFNVDTGATYHWINRAWEDAFGTGENCYNAAGQDSSAMETYIKQSMNTPVLGTDTAFENLTGDVFNLPTFTWTEDEIKAKLS